MEKCELLKINCQAVVLVKEGDKIIREDISQTVACYTLEQMAEFYAKAMEEVEALNPKNDRATRRKNDNSRKTD